MRKDYRAFLDTKFIRASAKGFEPAPAPKFFSPLQKAATEFCIRQGRSAIFLDTGLGKTLIELEFLEQTSARHDNAPALIFAPLAVTQQIAREADKFGYETNIIRERRDIRDGTNICNYDRLDKLDPAEFCAVALDESGILKNFTGATTQALIAAFADTPLKLCATAVPAPNDHSELGTHSEFLGIMPRVEMLANWFLNDTAHTGNWRLKRHAEADFWDWIASWAMMASAPSDLGFDDTDYKLPPLQIHRHKTIGEAKAPKIIKGGGFFQINSMSATNMHDIKRSTIEQRAEAAATIIGASKQPWVIWCDGNYESDALHKAIINSYELRGDQTNEEKERILAAFAAGDILRLITKPRIAGFGLNWQHCADMIFSGRSFSYEMWYQSIRRAWRFDQKRPVNIHLIVAEGEDEIGAVIDRKSDDHIRMQAAMRRAMARTLGKQTTRQRAYNPQHEAEIPQWLN